MPSADQLLAVAESYKGVTESPPGSNLQPFAAMAGHPNGYAWCASYVVACFRQAGMRLPSESAWTPAMAAGFKAAGEWHDGAAGVQRGDVLFWDFPDATTGIEHVSICTGPAPAAGEVSDIGGNTSDHADGSQDNGGGVFENTRSAAWVVGYGRPPYDASAAPVVVPAPPPPHVARPTIQMGARGADVVYLQRKLNVAADGIFGPITDRAVRAFQAGHRLGVDGVVGPLTWAALG